MADCCLSKIRHFLFNRQLSGHRDSRVQWNYKSSLQARMTSNIIRRYTECSDVINNRLSRNGSFVYRNIQLCISSEPNELYRNLKRHSETSTHVFKFVGLTRNCFLSP